MGDEFAGWRASASDPISDIVDAYERINAATYRRPDVLVVSPKVYDLLLDYEARQVYLTLVPWWREPEGRREMKNRVRWHIRWAAWGWWRQTAWRIYWRAYRRLRS